MNTVQNISKQICGWILTTRGRPFSLEGSVIMDYGLIFWPEVKNVLMMDLFLTNMQFSTSHDVNWWTGVVWITCGLLWCFYQLFGLSFWRHPFTAEHPLVSKWCNATFLQICSDEETNSSPSWMTWGWVNFQQIFIFGLTISLKARVWIL